jgi:hypothetical protein
MESHKDNSVSFSEPGNTIKKLSVESSLAIDMTDQRGETHEVRTGSGLLTQPPAPILFLAFIIHSQQNKYHLSIQCISSPVCSSEFLAIYPAAY